MYVGYLVLIFQAFLQSQTMLFNARKIIIFQMPMNSLQLVGRSKSKYKVKVPTTYRLGKN